jgi:putative DNA primase/helicase
VDAPATISRTMVEASGNWDNTPPLHGVVEAPTLRLDSTVLQNPGYDEVSALYFDPGATVFPAIPLNPTRAHAQDALRRLESVVGGFPFRDSASRSVAVSLMLSPFVRHAVRAVPLIGITAPKMGSVDILKTR